MAKALGFEFASWPEDFLTALSSLQEICGVSALKMSEYGTMGNSRKCEIEVSLAGVFCYFQNLWSVLTIKY
jgi:hypothetical protein